MAWKREVVGKVLKGKEGKGDYIQVARDVQLKKDEYLNLESKSTQLARIEELVETGKMGAEAAEAARERINKIPDFVRFEIVKVTKS